MMNMQSEWTTLEQSEKLVEAGLDKETADMFYIFDPFVQDIAGIGIGQPEEEGDVPCWTLGRLIELMPRENQSNTFEIAPSDVIENGYAVIIHTEKYYMPFNEQTLIDAVVNAVTWLLENNYINKGE